eukprot:GHRQ01032819.1.p1 GENE.GHRQ01032819.1~~GHRQ01032819.1.p1  ORF type:complete len:125 (-),score=7.02 GHRQ01032819.1:302-676(-)
MLDNVALIATLDQSKTTWEEVNESLRVAEETARQIEAASAQYRPCSVRAAMLYFVLNDLASECRVLKINNTLCGVMHVSCLCADFSSGLAQSTPYRALYHLTSVQQAITSRSFLWWPNCSAVDA